MSDRIVARSFARPDWRERILAGRSLMPDLPWLDRNKAERAIALYNALRIPDVPGQPLLGTVGADWFREIVGALHGSLGDDGQRGIKSVFCLVPKKNSKTTNASALMLTALMLNRRPRAKFLLIGSTQHIADESFDQVDGMIAADDELKQRLHVAAHRKTVTHKLSRAKLQVKSFDPDVVTGTKPAGVLVDELHLLGDRADADRVLRQLRGGILSQPEGFVIYITTQSDRPPAGVFKAELASARAMRDGRAAGSMLPILYEFPESIVAAPPGDKPRWLSDPSLWRWVNPNIDRSITLDGLLELFEEEERKGAGAVNGWASQHLNIEIGLALRSDRWPGAEFWSACAEPGLTVDALIGRSDVVVVGIDGGGLDDLLGLAVLGRDASTGAWLIWSKAWAHESVLERRKSEAPKIRDFAKLGELAIVAQPDFGELADIVKSIDATGKLAKANAIGVDPLGIGTIVDEIGKRDIDVERIVGISQGYKLNGAIKTLETKLAAGQVVHSGLALMQWCVGNARLEQRGNAELVTKQASGRAKIDPLMAAFNAVAVMALDPEPAGAIPDDYELPVWA